jgi:hypothetical protein
MCMLLSHQGLRHSSRSRDVVKQDHRTDGFANVTQESELRTCKTYRMTYHNGKGNRENDKPIFKASRRTVRIDSGLQRAPQPRHATKCVSVLDNTICGSVVECRGITDQLRQLGTVETLTVISRSLSIRSSAQLDIDRACAAFCSSACRLF